MRKLFIILTIVSSTYSQTSPKHEFRAAWVATAYGLDFPISNESTSAMQAEIVTMLDSLKHNGFNAVIFQVRPGCDAFYESAYEPWSHHLTGTSGQAPSPFFDPLQTWINEAHARNMELHAWFNPYRVTTIGDPNTLDPSHVYHQHPEWLLSVGAIAGLNQEYPGSDPFASDRDLRESLILDPGKAAVREYVISVFMDVVNNYDIDAVHMDDYFYPYGGMGNEDAETFLDEPRGFGSVSDWRRDNVNLLVEGIFDSIQVVKPWVKSGVSPFGIWKSGYPAGIVGTSSYYELYCDPMAWLNAGTIDYLTPQLYWEHGGGQDYGSLMPWWADSVSTNGRHLYVGHAPYRLTDWHNWPAAELPRQVRLNRNTDGCQGSVYFRLRNGVVNNPKGFLDSLDNDLYRYPALMPPMSWKDDVPPRSPANVEFNFADGLELIWSAPELAPDTDSAYQYVVYSSDDLPVNIDAAENIMTILRASETNYIIPEGSGDHFAITTLDRLGNESDAVQITPVSIRQDAKPRSLTSLGNYPNPFNPVTNISYNLSQQSHVSLTIYDALGRMVNTLESAIKSPGTYSLEWSGVDQNGMSVSSGIYFCKLNIDDPGSQGSEDFSQTIKMLYLR